ncbi:phage baseplate upper protein [Staphylococcus americanisciuri]|uniref:Phage baseplate upper protein n=1 Tax=Staphylococcus americanisciuri TaxID=2973940 RepID=A0ABT2F5R0_9STAP|nr:phage baseplate upper protein [Staphylococcus americanisciuri]MCS4487185.1 phage baseplate upper protein [Staphylococcus americanisciuri]
MVNYDARPNKKATINLDTTVFKQSRSDLNITFSTADRDTGIFEFIVTQGNKPLFIGNDNAIASIIFVHSNGLKVKMPLEIMDAMNGKLSVLLPNDLLKTPGNVTAQVYIARRSKTETQAVVAERIFSFTIEKSLAWEFDAETKLNYIIEFDELESQLKQRAHAIELAMRNGEDYVALINKAKEDGLSDIQVLKAETLDAIKNLSAAKTKELTVNATRYIGELTKIRDSINNKIDGFHNGIDENGSIMNSGSSLTDKNGYSMSIELLDFMNLGNSIMKSGLYYVQNVENAPSNESSNGYVLANFRSVDNGHLLYTPTDSKKIYSVQKVNGVWGSLRDLTRDMETETGSQSKADAAYENAINYFNEKTATNFKTLWEGAAKEKDTVIDLSESYEAYKMLIFVYNTVGGVKNTFKLVKNLKSIVIHDFNLSDTDAGTARFFEATLEAVGTTQFKIRNNNTYSAESNKGMLNSNAIEIREIVGVY